MLSFFNRSVGTAIIIYFEVSASKVVEALENGPFVGMDILRHGELPGLYFSILTVVQVRHRVVFLTSKIQLPIQLLVVFSTLAEIRRIYLSSTGTYPKTAGVLILWKSQIFLPASTDKIPLWLYFVYYMPILEKNTTLGTTLYAPVHNVHMGLHVALVLTILSASNTCQKTPSAKLQTVVSLVCFVVMSS